MTDASDPLRDADRLVLDTAPGVAAGPGVETRDAVLVTGPWLAGSSSLVAALRERLPDITFVEADELGATEAPRAVLFVVSAVGPLTESECALLDLAAARTDLVIGAVSRIDVHKNWREVLAADREALRGHADRYRTVAWAGVAVGAESEPNVDELVELLRERLGDPTLDRRNRLRAWEVRLTSAVRRSEQEADGADARLAKLREQRGAALSEHQMAKSDRTTALHSQIQQARAELCDFARGRCESVRTELAEDAASMSRRRLGGFEDYVRERVDDVVTEVNDGVTAHLRDMALQLRLAPPATGPAPASPTVGSPPLQSRNVQTLLMMLLGAGLGLGVALLLSWLFADLASWYTVCALAGGALIGAVLTGWLVGGRGLRRDRAVLDRWVSDVIDELQAAVDRLVGARVLAADTALTSELAAVEEAESAKLAERVASIDADVRRQGLAAARAKALRNRELPEFRNALQRVRTELDGS